MGSKEINIVGMGVMGVQIAALFCTLGYKVAVVSRGRVDERILQRSVKILNRALGIDQSENGEFKLLSEMSGIYRSYTIEAVSENLAIKKETYRKVREFSDAPYLSNTSSYAPDEIAEDVIGLHFFNPIKLRIVEVSGCGNGVGEILDDLQRAKFNIIDVNNNRGYIGNFLLFHEIGAALKLVDKYGYDSGAIRSIYNVLYDGRDIFLILDLIGLDVAYNIFKNLKEEDDSFYCPDCIGRAVGSGVLGKKNKTSILDVIDNK